MQLYGKFKMPYFFFSSLEIALHLHVWVRNYVKLAGNLIASQLQQIIVDHSNIQLASKYMHAAAHIPYNWESALLLINYSPIAVLTTQYLYLLFTSFLPKQAFATEITGHYLRSLKVYTHTYAPRIDYSATLNVRQKPPLHLLHKMNML